ncbi:MAG: D-glycerate dehydrogenase, partial [Acidimicrobiia bacterium]
MPVDLLRSAVFRYPSFCVRQRLPATGGNALALPAVRAFVSNHIPEDILRPLRDVCEVVMSDIRGPVPPDRLATELSGCQGLLSMLTDVLDEDLLSASPDLRVISQMSVGVDNIDIGACRRRGIPVGHTPDVLTETVADAAFALMGAVMRRIPEGADRVLGGVWGPWSPWDFLGHDLHGSALGVVGMGRIGQAIARRARGFDMEMRYTSPSDKPVPDAIRLSLEDLLTESSVVVLAAPLTEETTGMIGARELALMGPDSFLINVARGQLVNTDALVDALQRKVIGGAALDVTDPEPLPPEHPLLGFRNCLVVPH